MCRASAYIDILANAVVLGTEARSGLKACTALHVDLLLLGVSGASGWVCARLQHSHSTHAYTLHVSVFDLPQLKPYLAVFLYPARCSDQDLEMT